MSPSRANSQPQSVLMPLLKEFNQDHSRAMAKLHSSSFKKGWTEKAIEKLASAPDNFTQLAVTESGVLSGFILCRIAVDQGEILTLVVDEVARRQGIGGQLLRRALEFFREHSASQVFLEVAQDNEAAKKLYANQGFMKVGLRPNYTYDAKGRLTDAWLMGREIC
jgi:[ribosomal protein S18]-alanine N-acetyltransferase